MARSFIYQLTTAVCICGLSLALAVPSMAQSDVESEHQPVVQRQDYILDLPTANGLSRDDLRRLQSWLAALAPTYGDSVGLDPGAAPEDETLRAVISTVLEQYGLPLARSAPVTQGQLGEGQIRIVLSRHSASVPGCPDWSRHSMANSARRNLSNYGCATNATLAAMLADPADLLIGRKALPGSLSPISNRAIQAYKGGIGVGAGAGTATALAPALAGQTGAGVSGK